MLLGAGVCDDPAPKAPAKNLNDLTDEERGFKFIDPNAPLDLSILNQVDEDDDPNPFAGFDWVP